MTKDVIAIDGDGVIFNWNDAYASLWKRCFNEEVVVHDEKAYYAIDRFKVPKLVGEKHQHFRSSRDEQFWTTMPILPGAIEACYLLIDAGFELVMVTAADHSTREYRQHNLTSMGVPISKVYTVSDKPTTISPKAKVLEELRPLVFIDDYLPYFKGIRPSIYKVLIDRNKECPNNPNQGVGRKHIQMFSDSLLDYAQRITTPNRL